MIKRILLAEDDRGTALVVRTQLEKNGFLVYTASNGIEALQILETNTVDLLITDVVMPKMDGVDLYEAVKKNPRTIHLPIIIVTDKAIFKESFATLGVSNFVEKTTDLKTLLDKIKSIDQHMEEAKKFPKVLSCGNHRLVLEQINNALQGLRYLSVNATSSDEIISKALTMKPHAIILDVLFQDQVSAAELIKALRCFSSLGSTKIITYAYFPEDLGMDVEAVESVKIAMNACNQAGAQLYIGKFNQNFLVEKLQSLGI